MKTDVVQLFENPWLALGATIGVIMGYLSVNAIMLIWLERKFAARIQRRIGPQRGPFGLMQQIFDMGKLLSKELLTPAHVDRLLYVIAPVMVFTPVVALFSLFPITRNYIFHDFNIAIILILAISGINVLGIFLAGWGSNNKYALLGAVRAVAQNISYEIPLILSIIPIVMMTRTMSLYDITLAQSSYPFMLVQPIAFIIFIIAGTAETNRAPFDIPEAESELIAGFHTEYSGMRFGLFFFAEYSNMIFVSALATVIFLGGWRGPFLPDALWFFIKVYSLIILMMWFRWTFPRLRFDQLMKFAWVVLVPLSLINLLITTLILKLV
jgi:NADH-quinone oxidoreductase subunit H